LQSGASSLKKLDAPLFVMKNDALYFIQNGKHFK